MVGGQRRILEHKVIDAVAARDGLRLRASAADNVFVRWVVTFDTVLVVVVPIILLCSSIKKARLNSETYETLETSSKQACHGTARLSKINQLASQTFPSLTKTTERMLKKLENCTSAQSFTMKFATLSPLSNPESSIPLFTSKTARFPHFFE